MEHYRSREPIMIVVVVVVDEIDRDCIPPLFYPVALLLLGLLVELHTHNHTHTHYYT